MAEPLTRADARNRSLRTFATGLGLDAGVAAAVLVAQQVGSINSRAALALFTVALAKTVTQAGASYVLRYLAPPAAAAPVGGPVAAAAASTPEVTAPPVGPAAVPSIPVQQVPPVS